MASEAARRWQLPLVRQLVFMRQALQYSELGNLLPVGLIDLILEIAARNERALPPGPMQRSYRVQGRPADYQGRLRANWSLVSDDPAI